MPLSVGCFTFHHGCHQYIHKTIIQFGEIGFGQREEHQRKAGGVVSQQHAVAVLHRHQLAVPVTQRVDMQCGLLIKPLGPSGYRQLPLTIQRRFREQLARGVECDHVLLGYCRRVGAPERA